MKGTTYARQCNFTVLHLFGIEFIYNTLACAVTCTHSSSRGTTIGSVKSGMQILVQSIPSGSESNESVLNKVSPFHYCWSPGPSPLLSGGRGLGQPPFIVSSLGPPPLSSRRNGSGLAPFIATSPAPSPSPLGEGPGLPSPPSLLLVGYWCQFYLMLGCNAKCLLELREDVLVCHCRFAKLWKCWPPRIG